MVIKLYMIKKCETITEKKELNRAVFEIERFLYTENGHLQMSKIQFLKYF